MSSLIRKLTSNRLVGEGEKIAKTAAIPAAVGGGLGYLGATGKLDYGPLPLDLLGGLAMQSAAIVAPTSLLDYKKREFASKWGEIATAVGSARLAAKYSGGHGRHASHHGELFSPISQFGADALMDATSRL